MEGRWVDQLVYTQARSYGVEHLAMLVIAQDGTRHISFTEQTKQISTYVWAAEGYVTSRAAEGSTWATPERIYTAGETDHLGFTIYLNATKWRFMLDRYGVAHYLLAKRDTGHCSIWLDNDALIHYLDYPKQWQPPDVDPANWWYPNEVMYVSLSGPTLDYSFIIDWNNWITGDRDQLYDNGVLTATLSGNTYGSIWSVTSEIGHMLLYEASTDTCVSSWGNLPWVTLSDATCLHDGTYYHVAGCSNGQPVYGRGYYDEVAGEWVWETFVLEDVRGYSAGHNDRDYVYVLKYPNGGIRCVWKDGWGYIRIANPWEDNMVVVEYEPSAAVDCIWPAVVENYRIGMGVRMTDGKTVRYYEFIEGAPGRWSIW